MRLFAVTLALATAALALSCDDPLGPLLDGKPYDLTRVNEEPVPWTSPGGIRIEEGWIKILDDTLAQRHESFSNGPSSGSWTISGKYTLNFGGVLIVDYRPNWNFSMPGTQHPVDTFHVSGNGLLLREAGFVIDPDTLVRYYAKP